MNPNHADCLGAETQALGEQDIWNTLAVMIYELGAISQNLILTKSQDESAKHGLLANAITEISDLITQCGMLHEKILAENPNLGTRMSWDGLVNFGIQRQLNRMKAYIDKEPRQPTIHEG